MRFSPLFAPLFAPVMALAFAGNLALAEPVPMSEDSFVLIANSAIETRNGRPSLVLASPPEGAPFSFGAAIVKDMVLENGTIEYEVSFDNTRTFAGVYFRLESQGNLEDFYLRAHRSGNPDASQYMPRFNGVPSWQLYSGPQNAAAIDLEHGGWIKVRLEVSGDRMDVYVGDMDTPALASVLKRDVMPGGIGFWGLNLGGPVWVSNINITPSETMELAGTPVPDDVAMAGTVMNWQVSETFDGATLDGKILLNGMADSVSYSPMAAEATGLVNLARLQGIADGKDTVFSRLTIEAATDTVRRFDLGFSDHARVYLNGQLLFEANDFLASRDYRFLGTVGFWDSLYLPLQAGSNELVIAVTENAADTTGWAIMGRFDNLDGLSLN